MEADPRWADKASRGIMVGYSECVEGGVLVYPGRNKQIITRKQVVVIESKVAKMLPLYSDRFLIDDPLLDSETAPARADPTEVEDSDSADNADEPQEAAEDGPSTPLTSPTRAAARAPLISTPVEHRHGHSTRGSARVGARALAMQEACAEQRTCCTGQVHSAAAADSDHECDAAESALASSQAGDLPENPRSISQALCGPQAYEWRGALEQELESCRSTNSYVEVADTPERFVRAVMVLRVSRKSDGSLKFKARLCPDGSSQVRGLDYDDSYSPTVRKTSIFMTLHVAAAQD
jgi:hypothetical protein